MQTFASKQPLTQQPASFTPSGDVKISLPVAYSPWEKLEGEQPEQPLLPTRSAKNNDDQAPTKPSYPTLVNTVDKTFLQAKLELNEPGDEYEQEADQVADKIMRMPEPNLTQRKCAHCEVEIQRKPVAPFAQRKSTIGVQGVSDAVSSQIQSTKGNGDRLSPAIKQFMESRFGKDFSNINIHTGGYASELSNQLSAQAFTAGNDIYFNEGKYAPESMAGKRLLAHELTHTVQQTGMINRDMGGSRTECTSTIASSSCATENQCANPDPVRDVSNRGRRLLKVYIDVERSNLEEAAPALAFGHSYIELIDADGRVYTYGFYPENRVPNQNQRVVPGCVHHPDQTHLACVDRVVSVELTEEQFQQALNAAQNICRERPSYGPAFTCTSFVDRVAEAAGIRLPSSRTTREYIINHTMGVNFPAGVQNPYTLLENLQRFGGPTSLLDTRRYSINETAQRIVDRYLYIVRETNSPNRRQNPADQEVFLRALEMRVMARNNVQFNNPEQVNQLRRALLGDSRINATQVEQIFVIIQ